jgi:xanthine/uracil/vitamin C permease (AzgA family)
LFGFDFALFMTDFFDTMGAMFAVAQEETRVARCLSRGRAGEVHPLLYATAVLFALAFVWPALQGLFSR